MYQIILISFVVTLVVVIVSIRNFLKRASVNTVSIASLHGTQRILAIIDALRRLNKKQSQDALLEFWTNTEPLLQEAIADNTASTREELVELLTQAHAYCSNRELAKSVMAMRNTLLDAA